MKFKRPEIVPMFKTTSGAPVETLDLWKKSELDTLLTEAHAFSKESLVDFIIENADRFIAILGIVERKGRPVGSKDKKPRKKASDIPIIPIKTDA